MSFVIVELYLVILWIILEIYYSKGIYGECNRKKFLKKVQISYLNYSFLFLALMVSLRHQSIGNDTQVYFEGFKQYIPNMTDTRYEPGYKFLCDLGKTLSNSPHIIIVISGILSSGLYYFSIRKNSGNPIMSVMLFVFLGFFDDSMNIMRQAIACAFVLLSYNYICKNKFVGFVSCILLAASFHLTAIIFTLMWPLRKFKVNKKALLILFGGIILIYIGFKSILALVESVFIQYENYQNSIYGEGAKFGALFKATNYGCLLIMVIIAYLVIGQSKFKTLKLDFIILMCIIGFAIQIISFQMSVIGRIALYFNAFQLFLIPNLISAIRNLENRQIIVVSTFLILNIFYWTVQLLRPGWNVIYPYHTFLFN